MINENNEIGNTIKYFREFKHLSQAKLAEQIGVSQRNVSYYESGDHIPPADVLKKLAIIFGITVDELVGTKKINSNGNCENFLYEDGLANWNIKQKSKEKGLSYEDVLERTCINNERFDLLWYGNVQPVAEELIRFSEVLDVSIDFLLDNSKREHITAEEEIILMYYRKSPTEIMELLNSFTALSERDKKKVLGKCLDLEDESITNNNSFRAKPQQSSIAADDSLRKTGTENMGK